MPTKATCGTLYRHGASRSTGSRCCREILCASRISQRQRKVRCDRWSCWFTIYTKEVERVAESLLKLPAKCSVIPSSSSKTKTEEGKTRQVELLIYYFGKESEKSCWVLFKAICKVFCYPFFFLHEYRIWFLLEQVMNTLVFPQIHQQQHN